MITASSLNDRIRVQAPTPIRLPSGEVVNQWSVPFALYAKVDVLGARSYTAALAEQTGCSLRVTIRERSILVGWRVLHGGGVYRVKAVLPHEQRGYQVLMLEVDDGNG